MTAAHAAEPTRAVERDHHRTVSPDIGTTPGVPVAEVTRRDAASGAGIVESVHAGHLVVTSADATLATLGDPDLVTFVRSTAKPLQATACLELLDVSGVTPTDVEVAVAWSSHRAEPVHLDAVSQLLRRSGTRPDDLTCPPARGEHDPGTGSARLLHNCSGKHALFALAGMEIGSPRERLLEPSGPLQRVVLELLAELLGPPAAIGVDGCGAPAVTAPLAAVARAYAAIATDDRFARVRTAGRRHPRLVGGDGRVESALLATGVVAKSGAEGLVAAGWTAPDGSPRGLAVKVADGAARAAAVAALTVLVELEAVPPDTWTPPPPLGGGRPAGEMRPTRAVREFARRVRDTRRREEERPPR